MIAPDQIARRDRLSAEAQLDVRHRRRGAEPPGQRLHRHVRDVPLEELTVRREEALANVGETIGTERTGGQ